MSSVSRSEEPCRSGSSFASAAYADVSADLASLLARLLARGASSDA